MRSIKSISMRSTAILGQSHEQVLQLQEVDLGDHGHRHEVEIIDGVGHAGYQIDQHEKHSQITLAHEEVLQLQEVDLGEHGHRHGVVSSDGVGHEGYQIDQREKHSQIRLVT